MNKTKLTLGLYFLLCFALTSLIAQDRVSSFLSYLDSKNNSDDLLVNGKVYNQKVNKAFGNPYYSNVDWMPGIIFIRDKVYHEKHLRLDLEKNNLILKKQLKNSTNISIILNESLIDSFQLGNSVFVAQKNENKKEDKYQWVEKIATKSMTLFRIERVLFVNDYNSRYPNGKYVQRPSNYVLHRNEKIMAFKSRKDLGKLFPEIKSKIYSFLNRTKIDLETANKSELVSLLNYMDGLL